MNIGMTNQIEAIIFDMGGTLRSSTKKDESSKLESVRKIIALLGADVPTNEFYNLLSERFRDYSRWARETLVDVCERELWTKWMLPDWPVENIGEIAVQLNEIWREGTADRIIFPETKEVVLELFRRGYRLGLVSNSISSVETPRALKELELTGCFETVILSCVVGIRKPNPAILLESTRRMEINPLKCAYIGNLLHRDVQAAKKAGFNRVIIRCDSQNFEVHQAEYPKFVPDYYIDNLYGLLNLFPPLQDKKAVHPTFDASISTMWAKKNFPELSDFFEGASRFGFSKIELNHQINTSMLVNVDMYQYEFSSIHEPCPSDIPVEELKERDWLISSPNEEYRKQGVKAIKRSIDLANQVRASVVVVHCGTVINDLSTEKTLRKLVDTGETTTDEYLESKRDMLKRRVALIDPCFKSVRKSLLELLEYAAPFQVRLGLENRYHFFDIPSLDEMGQLLALAGPDQLGFVYDVGHAQVLDTLGFFPHEEWLRRYSSRIIEVHLHDVIGVNDHYAPGLGEVDFGMVASYLPEDAVRTFEIHPANLPEQVKAGLKYLVKMGVVKPEKRRR